MPNNGTASSRSAREVLALYHQAMRDMSADELADLYAEDAVHEFPFASPGFPERFEGREAVRAGYRAAWGASPVEVEALEDVTVLVAEDSSVVVAEQVVVGRIPSSGTIRIPGLLVLHVEDGLLRRVRDYMDGYAVAGARGQAGSPS